MALLVLLLPVWASTLIGLVLLVGYLWLTLVEFDRGTVMDLVYPTLGLIVAYVASMALRYFGETRQRRKVTASFSQYVPGEVARRLIDEDRVAAAIHGERVDLSVIFCDLAGFTSLSATLEPTDVRTMLNCFYKHMAEAVLSNDGTIMKYVGDEVFAVFGAPLPNEHHPRSSDRVRGWLCSGRCPSSTATSPASAFRACASGSGSTPARLSPPTSATGGDGSTTW